MKAFGASVFVSSLLVSSVSVARPLAWERLETRCPERADIEYIEGLAQYQAVLPGTRIQLESQWVEQPGEIQSFDSVFVNVDTGSFVHCVYKLDNNETMVLWPTQRVNAKQAATGPWSPFLEYRFCADLAECRFSVYKDRH